MPQTHYSRLLLHMLVCDDRSISVTATVAEIERLNIAHITIYTGTHAVRKTIAADIITPAEQFDSIDHTYAGLQQVREVSWVEHASDCRYRYALIAARLKPNKYSVRIETT
jgi:hypothetical protein